MASPLLPVLLLALPAIAWGGMFHVAQRVFPVVDPYWLTLLRMGPTALFMLGLLAWREGAAALLPPAGQRARVAISGTIGFAIFSFALYSGLLLTSPEHGAVIMSLTPLLGAALAWLISRRAPPAVTLVCIGIALLGAVLVVTGHGAGGGEHPRAWLGDMLALLGALSWAFYLRTVGWFPGYSSLRFTALTTATGSVAIAVGVAALGPVGLAHTPAWDSLGPVAAELIYMVFIGTLLALHLWNRGVALVGPVNGALFMNLVPVSALVIGAALGHQPTLQELAGTLCVVGALAVNNLAQRTRGTLPTALKLQGETL